MTIPRAIQIALASTLVVYGAVALAVLAVLGPGRLAASTAPLADAVGLGPWPALEPVVRGGAAVAAAGSLLALILGVSRTTLAMARDGHLPSTPWPRCTRATGCPTARSWPWAPWSPWSSAWPTSAARSASPRSPCWPTTPSPTPAPGRWTAERARRAVPAVGLAGCVALALALPPASTAAGLGVLAAGALLWRVRRAPARPPT